ncbi:MAG: nickel-binding protein [Planctomycetota bacterium]|jgi:hypothetical protein
MDRAFVDPASGNTSCVWEAPSDSDVTALFAKAGVAVNSITEVEEVTAEGVS